MRKMSIEEYREYERRQAINMDAEEVLKRCVSCGSRENLSELDYRGSGLYICDECKFKQEGENDSCNNVNILMNKEQELIDKNKDEYSISLISSTLMHVSGWMVGNRKLKEIICAMDTFHEQAEIMKNELSRELREMDAINLAKRIVQTYEDGLDTTLQL